MAKCYPKKQVTHKAKNTMRCTGSERKDSRAERNARTCTETALNVSERLNFLTLSVLSALRSLGKTIASIVLVPALVALPRLTKQLQGLLVTDFKAALGFPFSCMSFLSFCVPRVTQASPSRSAVFRGQEHAERADGDRACQHRNAERPSTRLLSGGHAT